MTYLKDEITGAVRKFDEEIPKEKRRMKVFLKAKMYSYDSDENKTNASIGRWKKTTKTEYTKWVNSTKPVEVASKEVE